LDLGIVTGYLSRFLVFWWQCRVDGTAIDPIVAAEAREWCDRIVAADLERIVLADHFLAGVYDVIVCADVLQYLEDPLAVLRQLPPLLAPHGRILLSIPNIANAEVIAQLLQGVLLDGDMGLGKPAGRRFFTRASLLDTLADAGLYAEALEVADPPIEHAEVDTALQRLSPGVQRLLLAQPDARAYRFIVRARPGPGLHSVERATRAAGTSTPAELADELLKAQHATLAGLERLNDQLARSLDRSDATIHTLEGRYAALEGRYAALETGFFRVLDSMSWRVTAPLRRAKAIVQRFQALLAAGPRGMADPAAVHPGTSAEIPTDRPPDAIQEGADEAGYRQWLMTYDTLTASDRAAARRHLGSLAYKPLISVVMIASRMSATWLPHALDSLRRQLYPNWELYIAGDTETDPCIEKILAEYAGRDARIKRISRHQAEPSSANVIRVLQIAAGDFITWLRPVDELSEEALYLVVGELNAHPDADLLYSDEDKIDEKQERHDPYFKPDWNPDLFLAQNFVRCLGVFRTSVARKLVGERPGDEADLDWELAIRMVEQLPSSHIRHLPFVLYHRRAGTRSTGVATEPRDAEATGVDLVRSHFDRLGLNVDVQATREGYLRIRYPLPQQPPVVSLIVPTRNRFSLLRRCVESVYLKTTYPAFELIIVDNRSDDTRVLDYLENLQTARGVKVLRYDAVFNYSAINNLAVQHARGEVICLLNNDTELITPDWLEELVGHALRPEIGAVGPMLYYPNGTIQHAGVILGLFGAAAHAYKGCPRGYSGHGGRALVSQNVSAVTGACLVVRKALYDEVGGLDERHLANGYSDIDFCLSLGERGYRNLWTPHAALYHHESASRGDALAPEEGLRAAGEFAFFRERWSALLSHDPAYNPNLSLRSFAASLAFPPRVKKPWRLTA
jgi:GT2 family glycosyltransferase/SAM-dependent methyltransferase